MILAVVVAWLSASVAPAQQETVAPGADASVAPTPGEALGSPAVSGSDGVVPVGGAALAPVDDASASVPSAEEAQAVEPIELELFVAPGALDRRISWSAGDWQRMPVELTLRIANNTAAPFEGLLTIAQTDVREQVVLPPHSNRVFTYLSALRYTWLNVPSLSARLATPDGRIAYRSDQLGAGVSYSQYYFALGVRPGDDLEGVRRSSAGAPWIMQDVEVRAVVPLRVPRHALAWGPPGTLLIYPEALEGLSDVQLDALRERLAMRLDRLLFFSRGRPAPFADTLFEPYLPVREMGDSSALQARAFGVPQADRAGLVPLTLVEAIGSAPPPPATASFFRPQFGGFPEGSMGEEEEIKPPEIPTALSGVVVARVGAGYIPFDMSASALKAWPDRQEFLTAFDLSVPGPPDVADNLTLAYTNQSATDALAERLLERALPSKNLLLGMLVGSLALTGLLLFLAARLRRRFDGDPTRTFAMLPVAIGAAGAAALLIVWWRAVGAPSTAQLTVLTPRGEGIMRTSFLGLLAHREGIHELSTGAGGILQLEPTQTLNPLRRSMPSRGRDAHSLHDIALRRHEFDLYGAREWLAWPELLSLDAESTSSVTITASPALRDSRARGLRDIVVLAYTEMGSESAEIDALRPGESASPTFGHLPLQGLQHPLGSLLYYFGSSYGEGVVSYYVFAEIDSEEETSLGAPFYLDGEPVEPTEERTFYWQRFEKRFAAPAAPAAEEAEEGATEGEVGAGE